MRWKPLGSTWYVQEKAADELGGVERHALEPVAAFDAVVLPLEGDARLVERDQPGVGDGDVSQRSPPLSASA